MLKSIMLFSIVTYMIVAVVNAVICLDCFDGSVVEQWVDFRVLDGVECWCDVDSLT